jgi:single-strand DNA-binding protein
MKEIRLLEQNLVMISGHLAADPDFRVTPSGTTVCKFRVAVNRRFKDMKSGEWKDDTAWVPVDVWREAAERLKDKLRKGSPVHVEGRLKTETYEDKQGNKRSGWSVVAKRVQFLAKLGGGAGGGSAPESAAKMDAGLEEVPF